MDRQVMRLCALAVLTSIVFACGRSSRDRASSNTGYASIDQTDPDPTISMDTPTTTAGKKKATCFPTGLWALCSVEKRLTQSGFVVRKNDSTPPARSGFSIRPTVYTLGHSRLEVFLYPNAAAVAREVAKLDTVKIAPVGGANSWQGMPTFVRSANLLAVFITDNPRSAERVSLALTAGAPQPATVPQLKPMVSTPATSR